MTCTSLRKNMGGKCSERVIIMLANLKNSNETVNTIRYTNFYTPVESKHNQTDRHANPEAHQPSRTHSLSTLRLSFTTFPFLHACCLFNSTFFSLILQTLSVLYSVVFFHSPLVGHYQVLSEAL